MPVDAAAGSRRLLPMTVDNIGFLLDRLGQDCHPLQFVRELTKNSIEAIERTKSDGQIIWDYEPAAFQLEGIRRLSIVDTGDGMTGEELVKFINQLSSSLTKQSLQGNYGVGAKIAAATRNPGGVSYFSWKDGQGSMIQLHRDDLTGQYGLKQWERADHSWTHYLPIEDELKPSAIKEHGTMVVLHGQSDADNTLLAPTGAPAARRWITRYLNTRYFQIPSNAQISCREGNLLVGGAADDLGTRRTILGQGEYLKRYGDTNGTVMLTGATAHWWIIRDRDEDQTDPIEKYSGHLESSGHAAALYQNELYEMTTGRAGMSRLQQFGITFGYQRVVIYIEPTANPRLTTNTARTSLLIGNEPLPWIEWAAEFRQKLPIEIRSFVESRAPEATSTDFIKSIRDRLKGIIDLYKVSRYRPVPDGSLKIDIDTMTRGGKPAVTGLTRATTDTPVVKEQRTPGGKDGNLYALFERTDGSSGERSSRIFFRKLIGSPKRMDLARPATWKIELRNISLIKIAYWLTRTFVFFKI